LLDQGRVQANEDPGEPTDLSETVTASLSSKICPVEYPRQWRSKMGDGIDGARGPLRCYKVDKKLQYHQQKSELDSSEVEEAGYETGEPGD